LNLISNAIKFSPEGKDIHITIDAEKNPWVLKVRDEGIGISIADQANLFDRFFRGSNAANIQGTGLGLHIVSKYVQLMHGEITYHSEINRGTEFILKFP
jgi:signal transduction histidine kinase